MDFADRWRRFWRRLPPLAASAVVFAAIGAIGGAMCVRNLGDDRTTGAALLVIGAAGVCWFLRNWRVDYVESRRGRRRIVKK